MIDYRNLRIAVLGGGNVGANVVDLLTRHREELEARVGAGLEVIGVAVRDTGATRTPAIPAALLTTDAESLVTSADIVVELIGGIEPARTLIVAALAAGADVITANKALLATHGEELFEAAAQVGAQLHYEAAVAAAIPIIRPLRESLAGDRVRRILGIVNGSTNFILDKMDQEGWATEEAMRVARELGYLEADPTLDVEGFDAAQKAAILASLAFHTRVPVEAVHREGITSITGADVAAAKAAGYVVKLLAIAERVSDEDGTEGVVARVHPALVPREHPLAAVHGGNNAVFVEAEFAGPLMFYGAGAGGVQTASAVLGDIVSAARRHLAGGPGVAESTSGGMPILDFEAVPTRYQIVLEVADVPGVLAQVAGVIADQGVSIEQALQSAGRGEAADPTATLVVVTHRAREAALVATVAALNGSSAVRRVTSVIRVEGL